MVRQRLVLPGPSIPRSPLPGLALGAAGGGRRALPASWPRSRARGGMAGAQQCLLQLHRCLQPGDAAGSALQGYSLLRSLGETCVASLDSGEQGAPGAAPAWGEPGGPGGLGAGGTRSARPSVRAAPRCVSPVAPGRGVSCPRSPLTGVKALAPLC